MTLFKDRSDAGMQLSTKLQCFAQHPAATVFALPRGGVPVAAKLARQLGLPLDVWVVRKLGAPDQPELAMGAIATGGAVVFNPEVRARFENHSELIDAVTLHEQQELQRRETAYRGTHEPPAAQKLAIVVDDGAATGASMRAAICGLRSTGVKRIVVGLPVCSVEADYLLRQEADEVICVMVPPEFTSVGQWYENFDQTSDAEVGILLRQATETP